MPVETKISFSDGSSSTDTLRKLSDDFSRKHLSDLVEAEEDGEVSSSLPSDRIRPHRKASTSSTYSITSMDALWEKHPRRLSEAGLRRSSDHSVVLTEDTDSFIIGDRVWVGGTKPGQIAYIGETQFAPGEWAGIVLDDPIGKNDGSVAGVRYFQCSEKRGVFSRLTRLTRVPFAYHDASPVSDAGSVFDRPPSGASRPRRTLSPNGSIRSAISSKMNMSVTTSGGNGELRLGERVIVSSSRGSKAGTLRYVGVTEFASGVWAGVELDDPLGKNDGSVDGKRYFECSYRFGLFAPISKVTRSPSNRKPGACAIHSNGNGRATPVRRSTSRDSLTSLGTSLASSRVTATGPAGGRFAQRLAPRASSTPASAKNALQELLREKQHHLERLMKERELERADVAKLTLEASRTETALVQLKKDAALSNSENEKLKLELEHLRKTLEDERQKVEDLMFRNEEENINKEDYNRYRADMEKEKNALEHRIRDLEAEAALQAARAETASATIRDLEEQLTAELAASHEQHKEELSAAQTLSSELQKLLDEAYALLKEKEDEKDSMGKSMSEELAKLKSESERALSDAKTKMAIAQTEFETQLSVLSGKLQLAEAKLENEKQNNEKLSKDNSQTVIDLNTKLSQLQAAYDDKSYELNKVLNTNKEHELTLNKEITKLKMELSAKVLDMEQLTETNKKQEDNYRALESEIISVKEELTSKVNEYENLLNEASQQNEKYTNEIIELTQNLTSKSREFEKLLTESGATNSATEKLMVEYKQTIHERDKEIVKLKNDYEQANATFNIHQSKIAEEHKKEINERNDKIDELLKEIEIHKQSLEKTKIEIDGLNSQFNVNVDEIKQLKDEKEKLKKSVNDLTQINSDLKNKISSLELEIGELNRQLNTTLEHCSELQKSKEKLESEYLNLSGQSTDSNDQFNKLTQHLKETEKELQEAKDKHRESTNTYSRHEQELKQQLFKIQEDFSVERGQLIRTLDDTIEKSKLQEQKMIDYEQEIGTFKEMLKQAELNHNKLIDENTILKNDIDNLKLKEVEINDEHEKLRKQLEEDIDKYKEKVSLLKAEGETSEVTLMEKVDQLIETQNELNNKLEESQKHENALQKVIDNMTSQLNNQKSEFEKEISQTKALLTLSKDEVNSYLSSETVLKQQLLEKDNSVKELTLKLNMHEVDLNSNVEILAEKDRQIQSVNDELIKINNTKKDLEEKLMECGRELADLKQKYEVITNNSSVEKSLNNEQLQLIEALKIELVTLKQEKASLDTHYNETNNELNKVKNDKLDMDKQLQTASNANCELSNILKEKEMSLKNQCDITNSELNKLKLIEEEITRLRQDLSNKSSTIEEIMKLNNNLLSNNNETKLQIQALQDENTLLNSKYKNDVEGLNKIIHELQNQMTTQNNYLEEVNQSKNKVSELQTLIQKSENDIQQLTNINEGQKANYEDLNKQLQSQYNELKKDSKRTKHELKAKLVEYEKELEDKKNKVSAEIAKQVELQQKLEENEKKTLEISNKLELLSLQQNTSVEKDDKLEKLTLELQAVRKSNSEALANSESVINKFRSEIETKMRDLKDKDNIIGKLQEELKNYKVKAELSEREKVQLQKELTSVPNSIRKDNNDNDSITLQDNSQTVQEEKEMIDGQVSFLNSVIVDMQRKNEQLMARVQALESGGIEPEPIIYNGLKPRPPPRLFCDICDVFDAHDTEECPRQEAAPARPSRPAPPSAAARVPPRPYCDICEVFGHSTENCDEEETF